MKGQDKIPAGKVQRASRLVKTGAKVGANYVKHYTKKVFDPKLKKEELDKQNAEDVYDTLSELKGSALKVAQMLSMEKGVMPTAYMDKFSMAQYSAPPLSGPLVVKTFRKYFGKSPQEVFDEFEMESTHAASIGQVHTAYKDGKKLAVKIQYPGVRDSVKSDLRLVKPVAVRILGFKEKDLQEYFNEVETMLVSETDYELEAKRGMEISKACSSIKNLQFPKYYKKLSGKRIITMDWLDGMHLKEFLATNPSQEIKNQIGQALWEFINYQMHTLQKVHADPHPGNYLMTADGKLGVIDFGCVKVLPYEFYNDYFSVIHPDVRKDAETLERISANLGFVRPEDSGEEKTFFLGILEEFLELVGRPFYQDEFDFSDQAYLEKLYKFGEEVSELPEVKNSKVVRGSRHALYINRTYFGLYTILSDLGAKVQTGDDWLTKIKLPD